MAQIFDPNLEEDQEEQQSQGPAASSNTAPTGGAPSTAPSQGAKKGPTSSGRFTNIQNYIQASKAGGAKQAQELGSQLTAGADKTKANITSAGTAAKGEVTTLGDSVSNIQDQSKQALQQLSQYEQPTPLAQPQVDEQAGVVEAGLDSQYKTDIGQKQIQDELNLIKSSQEAQERAAATTTEQGRTQLLKETFAKPTYTAGQQKLDQLLLGSSKENLGQLAGARQAARQLTPELAAQKQALENMKLGLVGEDGSLTTAQKSIKDELSRQSEAVDKVGDTPDLTTLAGQLRNAANLANDRNNQSIGVMSPKEMERLKQSEAGSLLFSDGQNTTIKGAETLLPGYLDMNSLGINSGKFSPILSEVNSQANLQNINPEALARLNALRKLSGQAELSASEQFKEGKGNEINPEFTKDIRAAINENEKLRSLPEYKYHDDALRQAEITSKNFDPKQAIALLKDPKKLADLERKTPGIGLGLVIRYGQDLTPAEHKALANEVNYARRSYLDKKPGSDDYRYIPDFSKLQKYNDFSVAAWMENGPFNKSNPNFKNDSKNAYSKSVYNNAIKARAAMGSVLTKYGIKTQGTPVGLVGDAVRK